MGQIFLDEILWNQYDAFNYPTAEDMHKRHLQKGNPQWPTATVEEWEAALRKAQRRAKEMDLKTATRLLVEPQRIYHITPTKERDEKPKRDDDGFTDYPNGLLVAIDHANKDFNLVLRNILMRHICDKSGIPNLNTLRSFIETQR